MISSNKSQAIDGRLLVIIFKEEIRRSEIPLFRGAVIDSLNTNNILFHNHIGNSGFRYSYPLIQYKSIKGHAAIVCLDEGTDAIGSFFSNERHEVLLGDRAITLDIEDIIVNRIDLSESAEPQYFQIRNWLPLNQQNYSAYQGLEGVVEKCNFLERKLIGNILSFAKGLDIHLDFNVDIQILKLDEKESTLFKGVMMETFDVEFRANINLPEYIGLGKGISIGFGLINRIKSNH